MNEYVDYQVNSKEKRYLIIRIIFSALFYILLVGAIAFFMTLGESIIAPVAVGVFYIFLLLVFILVRTGILVGFLEGNAIKVSNRQFPDIQFIVEKQTQLLGLSKVPRVYILQSGGILNAFVTHFFGASYIVLYSEMVEAAYEKDSAVIEFVIGHELGHLKRKHMLTSLLLFPSAIVPFLAAAHSRGCEYTCDAIGFALSPSGAKNGLLLLASGKGLMNKVKVAEYTAQTTSNEGFWCWFSEKWMTHPHLSKRLSVCNSLIIEPISSIASKPIVEVEKDKEAEPIDDHSKYMPQF